MALNLLKLPYLAQKSVVKKMRICDIFALSTCSSRMYRTIQTMRMKAKKIRYGVDIDLFGVEIRDFYNDMRHYVVTFLITKTISEQNEVLRICGANVKWFSHRVECDEKSMAKIQEAVHKHVCNLFNYSDIIHLTFLSENVETLPNLEGITDICLLGDSIETSKIEEILAKYPMRQSIVICGLPKGHFSTNSSIYQIDEVSFRNCGEVGPPFLDYFEGRFLILDGVKIHEDRITQFIKDWISGEKYQNLEFLFVDQFRPYNLYDGILPKLAEVSKKWDPARRPRDYEHVKRIIGLEEHVIIDCSEYTDFERKTDNKLASVDMGLYQFHFVVWK